MWQHPLESKMFLFIQDIVIFQAKTSINKVSRFLKSILGETLPIEAESRLISSNCGFAPLVSILIGRGLVRYTGRS